MWEHDTNKKSAEHIFISMSKMTSCGLEMLVAAFANGVSENDFYSREFMVY